MKQVKINSKDYPLTWRPGADRYLARLMGHTKVTETQKAIMSISELFSRKDQDTEVKDLEWELLNRVASVVLAGIYTGVKVEQRAGNKDVVFDLDIDDVYDELIANPMILADLVEEMSAGAAPVDPDEKKKQV